MDLSDLIARNAAFTPEKIAVHYAGGSLTYFGLAAHEPHHVALRVTAPVLDSAIRRLRQRGLPFGNDPGDPANGRTDDPLGATARIYFHDEDGHLFELFVPAAP